MKANLVLPNGTKVEIDGSLSEVRRLLDNFSGPSPGAPQAPSKSRGKPTAKSRDNDEEEGSGAVGELAIVNRIKEDESLQWLHAIVDSRDMTRRILAPLYVAAEIDSRADGLTSGLISRIYTELGVRIDTANVSRELSGKAKKYVLADKVRRKGAPVHYKISRAGRAFLRQDRDG